MAGTKPRDRPQDELLEAAERAATITPLGTSGAKDRRRAEERIRAVEVMTLRLAGLSSEQIAERLGVNTNAVIDMIEGMLARAAPSSDIAAMRELENMRLDRVQAAIWTQALEGNLDAVSTYLRLSAERSRLNGLYAPQQIRMRVEVRQEMEEALMELKTIVLGESQAQIEPHTPDGDHGPA